MSDSESVGAAAANKLASPATAGKQAVVLIHGIGNQTPMETLRPFVETVWTSETANLSPKSPGQHLTWSQHDRKSGDMELWRITTNAGANGVRTDFFELYWADMLEDTKLADVAWWLMRLLVRPISAFPRRAQQWQTLAVAAAVLSALVIGVILWGFVALNAIWGKTWWMFDLIVWVVVGLAALRGLWKAIPASTLVWRVARFAAVAVVALVIGYALWVWPGRAFVISLPSAYLSLVAIGLGLWWLRRTIFIQIAGDAARYLTPAPSNIGARKRIRVTGLRLLQAQHEDNAYDRIVVVGHSLGTVVGYDILSYYWADINDRIRHDPNNPVLRAVEEAGDVLLRNAPEKTPDDFRAAQRAYCDEVAARTGGAWKITDFVTLGSPLTHAHVLMVNDRQPLMPSECRAIGADWIQLWWRGFDDAFKGDGKIAAMFRARAAQRELPLCPPITESKIHFTYLPKANDSSLVVPHHAALFAATRWTNIYAPCRNVLWGDVVGGPVAPLFGPGGKDVALGAPDGGQFLAHTRYWDEGANTAAHLVALRAALDL